MPEDTPYKNETTNAVLKEMITGLTKITDERLLNIKDAVAEIKLLMQGFATKAEINEVKSDLLKHYEDDKKVFDDFSNSISFLTKVVFIGTGGFGVITFFLPFLIHYFWKI